MAYTYDDFVKAATNAGAMNRFSQEDLNITRTSPEFGLSMLKLYQDQQNATTAEQKLLTQEAENQLRKSYGSYSPQTPSYSYGNQTEYQKLMESILNPTPFSYDHSQDPQYSAYRKGYLREADRSREDTLAAVSAGSGGVPSSYAVTAAQQAGDYHVGKLNDMVPTLYQNALNKYYADMNQKLSALDALNADRSFDYSAYLQQLEKDLQAAELMASHGDYSMLGKYLGLTPEQMEMLKPKQGGGTNPNYRDILDSAIEDVLGRFGLSAGDGEYTDQHSLNDLTAMVRARYPSGEITDPEYWDMLVSTFGSDALQKIGIHQPVKRK